MSDVEQRALLAHFPVLVALTESALRDYERSAEREQRRLRDLRELQRITTRRPK